MEIYQLEKDIPVFYITADSFPAGIEQAHQRLHQLLPETKGRHFFGLSRPEDHVIVYKAAVEEEEPSEGKALGCRTMAIPKGNYVSLLIKNYTAHPPLISEAFQVLLADNRIQHDGGYCVEMYLGETDVRCMVRLRDDVKI